jgi:DNA-binding response OmpR family regulator
MARVTVINDSSEFLDLMRDVLTELGHSMVGMEAVEASIEEVVDSEPQLLIVDLRLQDTPQMMSGWELVVLARSHRALVGVPVILCSADFRELDKRAKDLEQIAGVHVMKKPFQLDEMSSMIGRLTTPIRPNDPTMILESSDGASRGAH